MPNTAGVRHIVGVPREVKNNEYRVAITPGGVRELTSRGHEVLLEHDAGVGSALTDHDFVAAGARIAPTPMPSGRRPTWCSRSRSRWRRSSTGCAPTRCCSPTCTLRRRGNAWVH